MKEEKEIFREWCELILEEQPEPLEYIYYRNTLDFQRYLLWYRYKELVGLIRKKLLDLFGKLISKGSSIRKGDK